MEKSRDVQNRALQNKGGVVCLADFERVVNSRSKVVSMSYVAYRNGYVYDIKPLGDLAHAHGAYLHVDAIQPVGAIRVDVKSTGIDFLTCGIHERLLGPIGLASFYVRQQLLADLTPLFRGFLQVRARTDGSHQYPCMLHESARKFEQVTLRSQGLYQLRRRWIASAVSA